MVVPACMCRPIIEFSRAVYIINPDFHLVLAGYQPAWVMWYIVLIPQALVLCLIYHACALGPAALGLCVYIRQSTQACGINIAYTMVWMNIVAACHKHWNVWVYQWKNNNVQYMYISCDASRMQSRCIWNTIKTFTQNCCRLDWDRCQIRSRCTSYQNSCQISPYIEFFRK